MKKLLMLTLALITPIFAAATETKALSDAEIVGIVLVVNQAEINGGILAQSASSNPDVKAFGHRLTEEHNDSTSQFNDWANKINIAPQSSSISDALKIDGEKYLGRLNELHGILFDLDYINHEVKSHQQVLDLWDGTLIPSAKNEELKHLLSLWRASLAGHFEQAKLIKTSLGRKK
jgi:putative membrane protein